MSLSHVKHAQDFSGALKKLAAASDARALTDDMVAQRQLVDIGSHDTHCRAPSCFASLETNSYRSSSTRKHDETVYCQKASASYQQ